MPRRAVWGADEPEGFARGCVATDALLEEQIPDNIFPQFSPKDFCLQGK